MRYCPGTRLFAKASGRVLRSVVCVLSVFFMALNAHGQTRELQMRYLGAAGWEVRSGDTVVLIDPYISRLRRGPPDGTVDSRRYFAETDYPAPDTEAIDRIVTRADFILVHHAHLDHILDVPYIAKKTGAKVIGTETVTNVLRAYGVPEEQLYAVEGGEDYQFQALSIRVIPSLHSASDGKHYLDARRYGEDLQAPLRITDFIEGGSLMFLFRLGGQQVLTMGSMNFIERELQGLKPDVLLAGAGASRKEIYRYTERLLTATGLPKIVLPTHWDNHEAAYGDEAALIKARKAKAEPFSQEVAAASPQSAVMIPRHFRPIVIRDGSIER